MLNQVLVKKFSFFFSSTKIFVEETKDLLSGFCLSCPEQQQQQQQQEQQRLQRRQQRRQQRRKQRRQQRRQRCQNLLLHGSILAGANKFLP